MSYYDPYKVLEVSYSADLETIRQAFRHQALTHHPDRGGNPHRFDLCKRAYNDIYKFKQQQQQQLHQESRTLNNMQQSRSNQKLAPTLNSSQQKSIQRNFNKIFNNIRIETSNDIGYGHLMEKTSANRDDNPTLQNNKKFKDQQLVIYEEPQPLSTLSANYEVLGEDKINDFGNRNNSGMQYTDYMKAHSDGNSISELANLKNVKDRPQYKTIGQLENARGNISYEMSPQDLQRHQMRKQQELETEEKRKMQFYQHKKNVEKKFNQIQNYLSYH